MSSSPSRPSYDAPPMFRTVLVGVALIVGTALSIGPIQASTRSGSGALVDPVSLGSGWITVPDVRLQPREHRYCEGQLAGDRQIIDFAARALSNPADHGAALHEVYRYRDAGAAYAEFAHVVEACRDYERTVGEDVVHVRTAVVDLDTDGPLVAMTVDATGVAGEPATVFFARSVPYVHVVTLLSEPTPQILAAVVAELESRAL